MLRKYLCLLILFVLSGTAVAQIDSSSLTAPQEQDIVHSYQDSIQRLRWLAMRDSVRRVRDSIHAVSDSVLLSWVKAPARGRPNRFRDSIVQYYMVKNLDFNAWRARFDKISKYDAGMARPKGELWVVIVVFALLLLFGIMRSSFSKELNALVFAFFSNRTLGQINKEEDFFNSWPFVFLYLLFGFTIGMFFYECTGYYQLTYGYSGISWYFRLSLVIIAMYTAKVFIINILGFLFGVRKLVREYSSILYMSYTCIAILFLPIILAFCLSPARFSPYYINLSLIVFGIVVIFQFMRAVTNILSGYRFPKFYLIIYLCALEICPLLILIKALRF